MASLPGFLGLPSLPRAWLSTGLRGTLHAAALPAGVFLQTSDTFCAHDLIFPRLPQTIWLAGPGVLPSVPWVGGQLGDFSPATQVETAVPSGEGARQGHRRCQHDSCPGGRLSVQGILQHLSSSVPSPHCTRPGPGIDTTSPARVCQLWEHGHGWPASLGERTAVPKSVFKQV